MTTSIYPKAREYLLSQVSQDVLALVMRKPQWTFADLLTSHRSFELILALAYLDSQELDSAQEPPQVPVFYWKITVQEALRRNGLQITDWRDETD